MTFWKGLKDAGLLEDIVEDLQKEIEEILKGLEERIHEPPLQVKGQRVYRVYRLFLMPSARLRLAA